MQTIFDHLSATAVGGTALVLLLFMWSQQSETAIDETRYHAAQEYQRVFAETFERDVLNLGTGVAVGAPMITTLDSTTFQFHGAINGTGTAREITYRRVLARTAADGTPLYRVERTVDGTPSGSSAPLVTRFAVTLLDSAGAATSAFTAARAVHLQVEQTVPFSTGGARPGRRPIERMLWETVYRPLNLRRTEHESYSTT